MPNNKNQNKIVALMYHGIDSVSEPSELIEKGDLIYVVDEGDFNKQMSYLAEQNVPVVTIKNDERSKELTEGYQYTTSVILTFDDGHITNYNKALSVLKLFGFNGYFFITTDWIGQKYFMTESMISDMHNAGMIIGSHGKTHQFLSDLSDSEANYELEYSKAILEEIIQDEVICFSAPGGRLDDRIVNLARGIGYSHIFSSESVINVSIDAGGIIGRFAIKRGQQFAEYTKLVAGCPSNWESLKYNTLKYMKLQLGNSNYEWIRNIVMKVYQ